MGRLKIEARMMGRWLPLPELRACDPPGSMADSEDAAVVLFRCMGPLSVVARVSGATWWELDSARVITASKVTILAVLTPGDTYETDVRGHKVRWTHVGDEQSAGRRARRTARVPVLV
jgi:hypothetical protein